MNLLSFSPATSFILGISCPGCGSGISVTCFSTGDAGSGFKPSRTSSTNDLKSCSPSFTFAMSFFCCSFLTSPFLQHCFNNLTTSSTASSDKS